MSIIVEDWNGDEVEVYARWSGGMMDTIVRAADLETFEAAALAQNILYEEEDEDGGIHIKAAAGVYLDHIGSVMLTPGTYDEEGNELTAPTYDSRHHVNMRIGQPAMSIMSETYPELPSFIVTGIMWSAYGQVDAQVNANEAALVLNSVALIDPETISSPTRVWA